MKIDLNLLSVFDKIYQERNLTKAGSSLGLTQSAVSQALARLRFHFKDELFFRVSQGMDPTEKAHKIAPHISAALSSAEQAFLTDEKFDPKVSNQVFKIGMIDLDVVFLGSKLVNHFKEKAPEIQIELVPTEPQDCLGSMDNGEINIAISCVEKKIPKRFYADVLFHDKLVIISNSNNPHIGNKLTLNHFLYLPHLSVPLGNFESKFIDPIFARKGIKRKIALTVSHMLAAPMLVKETDLIAPVYLTLMNYCSDIRGLNIHDFPVGKPTVPISLIWHQRVSDNRAYQWVIDEIKQVCEKIDIYQKKNYRT